MRNALKNLALAVFAILFLAGIGWMIATNRALSKPEPRPFQNAFYDYLVKAPRTIIRGSTVDELKAAPPDAILWIDARPSGEGTWWAMTSRALPEDPRMWVSYLHDSDIEKSNGGKFQKLVDLLNAFPSRYFVLNLQDYKEGGKEQIIKFMHDTGAGERSLITSSEDGILRDMREAEPTWIFGISRAQLTRVIMLSQIYLTASAPIKGDVFVWDPGVSIDKMNPSIWAEIQRRHMPSVFPASAPSYVHADALLK